MNLQQAYAALGLPLPVVYPKPAAVDREAETRAALARLTPAQHAIGEAISRQMREDAAWRRFRAQILGPVRG